MFDVRSCDFPQSLRDAARITRAFWVGFVFDYCPDTGGGGRVPDRIPTPIGAAPGAAPRASLCSSQARGAGPVLTAHDGMSWRKRRVLLLNTTFEPLTALPLRRAIVLIVCGKAEVVHGDSAGLVLHSATSVVEVPSVIRLSSFVRVPYRGRAPLTRSALMHRDAYRCAYCGARAETIVLRRAAGERGTDDRPRRAQEQGRAALVGELRGLLPQVQPSQGGQDAQRARVAAERGAAGAAWASLAASRGPVRNRSAVAALPR